MISCSHFWDNFPWHYGDYCVLFSRATMGLAHGPIIMAGMDESDFSLCYCHVRLLDDKNGDGYADVMLDFETVFFALFMDFAMSI